MNARQAPVLLPSLLVVAAASLSACAAPVLEDRDRQRSAVSETADCTEADGHAVCTYRSVSGLDLQVSVHRPSASGPHPALLWLHGGGLIMGHRDELSETQRARYVRAGYVVVAADYRLAPQAKLDEINGDVAAAYAWMRGAGAARFAIDPSRIAVIGHSAGGYLTLAAGARLSPKPQALVSFYGYGDVTTPWLTAPWQPYVDEGVEYDENGEVDTTIASRVEAGPVVAHDASGGEDRFNYYIFCRQTGQWPKRVGGHDPLTEAAWFRPYEGAKNVGPDYPPTFLLHGARDKDVPEEKLDDMIAALRAAGHEPRVARQSWWGHGFDEQGEGEEEEEERVTAEERERRRRVLEKTWEAVLAFLAEKV